MKNSEPPPSENSELDLSVDDNMKGTVFVTNDLDKIMDTISNFEEEVQQILYEKLELMNQDSRIICFVIAESFKSDKQDVFNMLFNYNQQPTLVYSTNEDLLIQFMADNTNITKDFMYEKFNLIKDKDDEGETDREA